MNPGAYFSFIRFFCLLRREIRTTAGNRVQNALGHAKARREQTEAAHLHFLRETFFKNKAMAARHATKLK